MKKRLTVLNGTNEVTNQDIGQIRVLETESGIEVTHYVTNREHFYSQYSLFAIKTAQSTVEMCRVVFEAKEQLSKEEFSNFCTDIGHKRSDSTIRKYLAIGAAYELLIQYVDKLPSKWTSIYTILQIPSETFNALIQVGESFANLTGDQIKALSRDATSTAETTIEVSSPETTTTSSTEDTDKSLVSNSETSSEVIDVVTASTDEISTDEDSSNLSNTDTDDSEDESVSDDAVVKANALLKRVTTTASTSMTVDIEDEFEPYKLLLCFNSQPSDDAALYLMDCINTLKTKFKVDIEYKFQELDLY